MVGAVEKCSFCDISGTVKGILLVSSASGDKKICNRCVSAFKQGIGAKPKGVTPAKEFKLTATKPMENEK